jgi:hypothetical protein
MQDLIHNGYTIHTGQADFARPVQALQQAGVLLPRQVGQLRPRAAG